VPAPSPIPEESKCPKRRKYGALYMVDCYLQSTENSD
jgi:hypothetical protein